MKWPAVLGVFVTLHVMMLPALSETNESTKSDRFVSAAKLRFADLRQSEDVLLRAFATEAVADLRPYLDATKAVRSEVLSWAIAQSDLGKVTKVGIQGGTIVGPIVLRDLEIGTVVIKGTTFTDPIYLQSLSANSLTLQDTQLRGLTLVSASIKGDVVFDHIKCDGEFGILISQIGGAFGLLDSELRSTAPSTETPIALHLKGTAIEHTCVLINVKLEGAANLNEITVGGRMGMEQVTLSCQTEIGLKIENAILEKSAELQLCRIAGMVSFDSTVIGGSLDVDRCECGRELVASISFDKSKVTGDLHIRGSQLIGTMIARDAKIDGVCMIDGTAMKGIGRYEASILAEGIRIGGSLKLGTPRDPAAAPQISKCVLAGGILLDRARVEGDLVLESVELDSMTHPTAYSSNGVEVGGSLLVGPGFHSKGSFVIAGCRVEKDVTVRESHLQNARSDCLQLVSTNIKGGVELEKVAFDADVTIASCEISKTLIWRENKFPANLKLRLLMTDCHGFGIIESEWPGVGHADIRQFTYKALLGDLSKADTGGAERARFLNSIKSDSAHLTEFHQLASVLAGAGFDDEATEIRVRVERMKDSDLSWMDVSWPFRKLYGWIVNYGYAPFRAVWWAIGVIALGRFVFAWADRHGLLVTAQTKAPVFRPLIYSVDLFFPFVDFLQADFRRPSDKAGKVVIATRYLSFSDTALLWGYFWIHIVAGWTISSLFAVALAGLIRGS